ncbi:hypothetical protein BS78_04G091200 [Paspalum vaginatum]|nr:hypothetical protein BS78_04G091200 [Paspalum vaginatum]
MAGHSPPSRGHPGPHGPPPVATPRAACRRPSSYRGRAQSSALLALLPLPRPAPRAADRPPAVAAPRAACLARSTSPDPGRCRSWRPRLCPVVVAEDAHLPLRPLHLPPPAPRPRDAMLPAGDLNRAAASSRAFQHRVGPPRPPALGVPPRPPRRLVNGRAGLPPRPRTILCNQTVYGFKKYRVFTIVLENRSILVMYI